MKKNFVIEIVEKYLEDDEDVLEIQVRDDYLRIDTVKPYRYDEDKKVFTSRYFKFNKELKIWLSDDVRVDLA